MSIEELKSNWDRIEGKPKPHQEILKMTRIKNHPQLQRLRVKFIIETVLLILFLLVYQDFFDAEKHSPLMNGLLIGAAVLYILNDVYGFWVIKNPIQAGNIKDSSRKFIQKLKMLSITSIASAFFFAITVIIYFSTVATFNSKKWIMLGVFAIILGGMFFMMYRNWKAKISGIMEFTKQLK